MPICSQSLPPLVAAQNGITVGNTATATFTLVVDSGATSSLSVTVAIVTGTYTTAASFQAGSASPNK